jgi:hypothetical protein
VLENVCEDVAVAPWTEVRADVHFDVHFEFVWHMEWKSGREDDGADKAGATYSFNGVTNRGACHATSLVIERSTVIECVQL